MLPAHGDSGLEQSAKLPPERTVAEGAKLVGMNSSDPTHPSSEIERLRLELEASRGRERELRDSLERGTTQRRRIQEQAEQSHERLLDTVEAIGDGFVLFDADERLVMKNKRMSELSPNLEMQFKIGDRLEDIVRRLCEEGHFAQFEELEQPDCADTIERRLALHRDAPSTHEQRYDNGRWILVSTRPTSGGGRVVAYTDITDRKAAEAALHEKRQLEHDLDIARDIQLGLLPTDNL